VTSPLRLPDVVALAAAMPDGAVDAAGRDAIGAALAGRAASAGKPLPPEWPFVVEQWLSGLGRGVARRGQSVVLDRRFVEGLLVEG
jgi:hypothetical protein